MDLVDVIYSVIILKQPMGDAHLIRKDSKDGHFSSKQAYKFLNSHSSSFCPVKIWYEFIPSSKYFVVWKAIHKKMTMNENL